MPWMPLTPSSEPPAAATGTTTAITVVPSLSAFVAATYISSTSCSLLVVKLAFLDYSRDVYTFRILCFPMRAVVARLTYSDT